MRTFDTSRLPRVTPKQEGGVPAFGPFAGLLLPEPVEEKVPEDKNPVPKQPKT